MKKKITIYNILLTIFALIFAAACFFLVKELVERRQAAVYMASLQSEYVPTIPTLPDTGSKVPEAGDAPVEEEAPVTMDQTSTANPSIQKLVSDYPDVVGWLTVEGANISHPFVQTDDNSSYLWADLDHKFINGGTLFMDYYNSKDCSDKITVIYGHNMKNGSMFGQLKKYLDFDYITENSDVYISFPESTAHYTAVACFVVDGANNIIFDSIGEKEDVQDVVDYICANTKVNPDVAMDGSSDILVLSTCHGSYETARTLLICIAD
ncbi:MAG: class B sortase [Oscillospiraceae bacterium]|nr:class B sortase [Oscillospiraceae bacterium]